MQSNTARKVESQPRQSFTEAELKAALNRWRSELLGWLGREMLQASQDLRAAEEGLAISHRNPGDVADDVVDYLWKKLEAKAVLLHRLDRVVQQIEEMDLPQLIVLFQRTTKLKTYPWEGDAWELPASMFH